MKKIIIFLLLQISLISQIFAIDVTINTDKNIYQPNEQIILNIEISSQDDQNISIENIEWLENFYQNSSSQSQQTTMINWQTSMQSFVNIGLKTDEIWNYTLWPVEIKSWEEIIESNTIEISVETGDNIQKQESEPIVFSKEENQEKIEFIESKNLEINFVKLALISIGSILFFVLFYFVLTKILSQNKLEKKEIIIEKKSEPKDFHQKIISQLEQLSQDSDNLEKTQFYRQLNIIFRNYFDLLWIKNAHTFTYQELKNQKIEEKLFKMFEKSYFEEFSFIEDIASQRKQIIMNFIIYLKK